MWTRVGPFARRDLVSQEGTDLWKREANAFAGTPEPQRSLPGAPSRSYARPRRRPLIALAKNGSRSSVARQYRLQRI